jgi:hypothetical protein
VNYFLSGLTPEQVALLQRSGVSINELEISGATGIMIAAEDRDRVMELLSCRVTRERRTEFEGVMELRYESTATSDLSGLAVTYLGNPLRHEYEQHMIGQVRDVLLPVVREAVTIHSEREGEVEPNDEGGFHIWINCAPEAEVGPERFGTPDRMWGHPVTCLEDGYQGLHDYFRADEFIATPEGDEVAQIVRHNLYIFHRLDFQGAQSEIEIFREILREAARLIDEREDDDEDEDELDDDDEDGEHEAPASESPDHTVIAAYEWNGYQRELFVQTAKRILLPVVKKDIVISIPHGDHALPANDGKFHIFIWSTPTGEQTSMVPTFIWGIPVNCRDTGMAYCGSGLNIVDSATDWSVAELIGDNLYVHHDLVHRGTPEEIQIFERLLQEVVTILNSSPEERAARMRYQTRVEFGNSENFSTEHRSEFKQATMEILAPVLPTDMMIRIIAAQGRAKKAYDDGVFRVNIWSALSGGYQKLPVTQLWDYPIPDQVAFAPCGEGVVFTDDKCTEVAELIDNNLYIHFPIYSQRARVDVALYKKILQDVATFMRMTAEERKAHIAEIVARKHQRSKVLYIESCVKRHNARKDELTKAVKRAHKDAASLQKSLAEAIRQHTIAQRELDALTPLVEADMAKFGEEFERMLAIPRVLKVVMDEKCITAYVDTLTCVNPKTGKRHLIGKFRIVLSLNPGSGDSIVTWHNLDRQVGDMFAPHVYASDGHACLGNASAIFPELIGKFEYAAALQIAIAFIESVNVDDSAGAKIVEWPVVEEKGAAVA